MSGSTGRVDTRQPKSFRLGSVDLWVHEDRVWLQAGGDTLAELVVPDVREYRNYTEAAYWLSGDRALLLPVASGRVIAARSSPPSVVLAGEIYRLDWANTPYPDGMLTSTFLDAYGAILAVTEMCAARVDQEGRILWAQPDSSDIRWLKAVDREALWLMSYNSLVGYRISDGSLVRARLPFLLAPREPTPWHLDSTEAEAAIRLRWPEAECESGEAGTSWLVMGSTGAPLIGQITPSGQTLFISGDDAAVAGVIAWWRRQAPAEVVFSLVRGEWVSQLDVNVGAALTDEQIAGLVPQWRTSRR